MNRTVSATMQQLRRALVANQVPVTAAIGGVVVAYALREAMKPTLKKEAYVPLRDPMPAQAIAAVPHYPDVRHDPATAVKDDAASPISGVAHSLSQPSEPSETVGGIPLDVVEGQAVEDAMKAGGERAAREVMEEIAARETDPEAAVRKVRQLSFVAARTQMRGGRNGRLDAAGAQAIRERMSGSLMRHLDEQCRSPADCTREATSAQAVRRGTTRRRISMMAGMAKPPPAQRMNMRPLEYGMPTKHPLDVVRDIGAGVAITGVRQTPNNTLSMDRPGASSLTDMQRDEGFSWAQKSRTAAAARGAGMAERRGRNDRQGSFCDRIRPKPCGCGGRCSHSKAMAVPHRMPNAPTHGARVSYL